MVNVEHMDKRWKVYIPGHSVYELYGETEEDIRAQIRREYERERVPNNPFLELANLEDERKMRENNQEINREVLKYMGSVCQAYPS